MTTGVMRFLQTEWHRHERDRNAWEIERQEMKARIASLEGSGRRSDAHVKGQRRYIDMLEKTLAVERRKNRRQVNGTTAGDEAEDKKAAADENKLGGCGRPSFGGQDKPHNSFLDVGDKDPRTDEDPETSAYEKFLDSCSGEFTYLMVSPANPPPPKDQIRRPELEDKRDGVLEQYAHKPQPGSNADLARLIEEDERLAERERMERRAQLQQQQQMMRAQPMVRETTRQGQQAELVSNYQRAFDAQTAALNEQQQRQPIDGEPVAQVSHVFDDYGRLVDSSDIAERTEGVATASSETSGSTTSGSETLGGESEHWDFGDSSSPPQSQSNESQPQSFTQPQEINPGPVTTRPDTILFPTALPDLPLTTLKSPQRSGQRRRSSATRRTTDEQALLAKREEGNFKLRFALRGHLDVVRAVIFTGGGSPGEPELCTAGDDGVVKRWVIPGGNITPNPSSQQQDLDVTPTFTHRGHSGAVLCLAAWHPTTHPTIGMGMGGGARQMGDGWLFSGGQDASIRVWERGRVDPKGTIDGHTDAVWAVCVLPTTCGGIFGAGSPHGSPDRIMLVSGSADGTVKVWSVSAPPALPSPTGSAGRRGGRQRGNSMSSGSNFPNSPQPTPSIALSTTPLSYNLIHSITREGSDASPTSIVPLGASGESFVVSYDDSAVRVYSTLSGEEMASMASAETYDGTKATSINAVVATTAGLDSSMTFDAGRGGVEERDVVSGATGGNGMVGMGVEGTVITGHEDCFVRFFDANSGEC